MMTLQVQLDDTMKADADGLFASLGQAIEDTRRRENLFGPFDTAEEAVSSMLED
ncbi:MAG: hypothetical protein IJT94_04390 [Oscillibacter sp.]|nr:hypothetical protein [Oscillibacter sp.]